MKNRYALLLTAWLLLCLAQPRPAATFQATTERQINWKDALRQQPDWYGEAAAVRLADNVLRWQRRNGGWPKNTDMAVASNAAAPESAEPDTTIDNGATYTQLEYLAKVFSATAQPRFKAAFLKGLDYLFAAQYANGGWPQFYPLRKGYYSHITYNDDAMVGVLTLLREVARGKPSYAFVDETRRQRAEQAVAKGIECILQTQIIVHGQRTAWCAQHDETTLQPAPARAYEKVSLSGSESVGLVRFLMGIETPEARVRAAIEAAVAWFAQSKLTGVKVIEKPDAKLPKGFDRVVVAEAQAPPLWARFYDINTNRPLFCGRDGVIKATLAEIEYERRTGYNWYTERPAELLAKDYPAWRAQQKK